MTAKRSGTGKGKRAQRRSERLSASLNLEPIVFTPDMVEFMPDLEPIELDLEPIAFDPLSLDDLDL